MLTIIVNRTRNKRKEDAMDLKLRRWAKREGKTVEWGNVVGYLQGQSFTETFATEEDAQERERQAMALEAIGKDREPVALTRVAP